MLKELKRFIEKLEPCDIFDENGFIKIYFHQIQSKACSVAKEFSKSADEFCIVESGLPEDSTVNYEVKFKQCRVNDIAFMQYCMLKDTRMGGCAIYGLPILEYWFGIECELPPSYMQMYVSETDKRHYKEILEYIYIACDEKLDYHYLPLNMPFKDKTHVMQSKAVEDFLNKNHSAYLERMEEKEKKKLEVFDGKLLAEAYKKDNEKFYKMLECFSIKYNLIYQKLLDRGEFSPKWKSEYELFQLLKKEYSDAIYQYRVRWLGHQSLDIFVPSEMLAFEYQGVQHFEPIEVFGGKEHFQRQLQLDKKKRELCIQNNVKLIEWRYDEPITKIILNQKIKSLDM